MHKTESPKVTVILQQANYKRQNFNFFFFPSPAFQYTLKGYGS